MDLNENVIGNDTTPQVASALARLAQNLTLKDLESGINRVNDWTEICQELIREVMQNNPNLDLEKDCEAIIKMASDLAEERFSGKVAAEDKGFEVRE